MTVMAHGTGSGYQHGTWEDEMAAGIEVFAAVWANLKEMRATLESRQAHPAHLEQVDQKIIDAASLAWSGAQILAATNERYKDLLHAYANLGGQVAGQKEYHTMAGA